MGYLRLHELPRTRERDQVVDLIKRDDDAAEIVAASLDAADRGFRQAAEDDGVAGATWLLTQLPLAAKDPNYVERLAALGVEVSGAPSLIELVGAFTDAVDSHMRQSGGRTDLGEMAQMAAAETLTSVLGQRTQSLFGTSAGADHYGRGMRPSEAAEAALVTVALGAESSGLLTLRRSLAAELAPQVPRACTAPDVRFMLTVEISNIYKHDGRTRKVHNLVCLPDLEAAAALTRALDRIGHIHSDGRPILGLDSRDLLEIVLETSGDRGVLIPAHIWTPW